MIAEGTIVGVFHNAHKLDSVVSGLNDARKGMFTEFSIGANFGIFLCHADVSFVYKWVANTFFGVGITPGVGCGRIPDLGRKDVSLWILNSTSCVGGNSFTTATRPKHLQFVEVFVSDGFERKFDFPDTGLISVVESEYFLNSPVGEVTNEIEGGGVWRPFTKDPFILPLVESKIFMRIGKFVETHAVLGEAFFKILNVFGTAFEIVFIGFQKGILI